MVARVKPPNDKPRGQHPIDVRIGLKIQQRRFQRGLTLNDLANKARINPQLIHSYEQAERHIPVWRLWQIAKALDCPIIWFFQGLEIGGEHDA